MCGRCLAQPPPYEAAGAAYAYGGALQDAITRWKNLPLPDLARPLGRLMMAQAEARGWRGLPGDTLVVPVPSHPRRLRQRGFNPAGVLARQLADDLELPLRGTGLAAARPISRARSLSREARRQRVQGVFQGQRRVLDGRDVLLIDDVMTTGATVAAASVACRKAGARSVQVAVLARVVR